MNYIKHLNAIYVKMAVDNKLSPHHISLYLALFHLWNQTHFEENFSILRSEVMQLSKIGSNNTYSKCLKALDKFGYIKYYPSNNPMVGSTVSCIKFDTTDDTTEGRQAIQQKGALYKHSTNKDKQKQTGKAKPTDLKMVQDYFFELLPDQPNIYATEAEKFYNHYSSNGWKVGGKSAMKDWKAAARNWKHNLEKFSKNNTKSNASRLKVSTNKNYNEPL